MEDLYRSGEYVERVPALHAEDSGWKVSHIVKLTRRLHPKSVCDVGCGAGLILHLLQKELPTGTTLHGYDISPRGN